MISELLFKTFASGASLLSCPGGGSCATGLPKVAGSSHELQYGLQIAFGIIAAVSVLIIVIGGLRFVMSEGNPENVAKARETIVYALVGLVISLIAETIVSFVLNKL